jgi:hypothetical protein
VGYPRLLAGTFSGVNPLRLVGLPVTLEVFGVPIIWRYIFASYGRTITLHFVELREFAYVYEVFDI